MWCECSYSCSGNCNPVPVEMPASSFPATLAATVHGVFFSLSADWCSNDSREELWPGQFGEGNFGRDAEHRGAVCSVPRCLLGEGNSSRYSAGEASCSINSRMPTKNPLECISDHIQCDPRKQSSDKFKWDEEQRHSSALTWREHWSGLTLSVLLGKVSFPFFVSVYNLHILCFDSCKSHCESPTLRAHVLLKRCQPLRWQKACVTEKGRNSRPRWG